MHWWWATLISQEPQLLLRTKLGIGVVVVDEADSLYKNNKIVFDEIVTLMIVVVVMMIELMMMIASMYRR